MQALNWSPEGTWLACQLAPGGGERTARAAGRPADGSRSRELAPGAAAVTLGVVVAQRAPARRHGLPGQGRGDGQACLVDVRDGTSTVLAAGPAARVCAVSGDGRRAVVRLGRRGARPPGAGRPADRAAHRAAARRRAPPWPTPGSASPAGSFTCTPTPGASGRRCSPSRCAARSSRRRRYAVAERDDDDLDLVALDPSGRACRAGLERARAAARSSCWTCARASSTRCPRPAGEVVTGAAFTRDGRALLVAAEGPTVPPRLSQDRPGARRRRRPAAAGGARHRRRAGHARRCTSTRPRTACR